jgi:hypothetical protein
MLLVYENHESSFSVYPRGRRDIFQEQVPAQQELIYLHSLRVSDKYLLVEEPIAQELLGPMRSLLKNDRVVFLQED